MSQQRIKYLIIKHFAAAGDWFTSSLDIFQELDLMIVVGLFQLKMFYDSIILTENPEGHFASRDYFGFYMKFVFFLITKFFHLTNGFVHDIWWENS